MMKTVTWKSTDETQTEALGRALAAELDPGTVLALRGELGTGKTVLTRGIARGLEITEPVTSPTFTVVQEYPLPTGGWLFHLDMYRISGSDDALAFGIEEYLFVPHAITVVEWPERIEELLQVPPPPASGHSPAPVLAEISVRHTVNGGRRFTLPQRFRRCLP